MGFRMPAGTRRRTQLNEELQRIVACLARAGAQKIVLFGSAATENVGSTSDLDLLQWNAFVRRAIAEGTVVYETKP